MELRLYELTFILDPQLEQNQVDEIINRVESQISEAKGEIVKKDIWGKRRLAYEINRRQYGFYVYLLIKGSGDLINVIERDLKLGESVLRFLTIRLSKAAIKQMEKEKKHSLKSEETVEDDKVTPPPKTEAEPVASEEAIANENEKE